MKFSGDRYGTFEFSPLLPHRCSYEVIGSEGCISVNDFVGGQGQSGNLNVYFS